MFKKIKDWVMEEWPFIMAIIVAASVDSNNLAWGMIILYLGSILYYMPLRKRGK